MKVFKLAIVLFAAVFSISNTYGQANASINILTLNSGQVTLGGTVDVQVTIGNTGPTSSIGVNKVRAQISVPTAICTIPAAQPGLPTGWTVLSNTGGVIVVCNGSDIIPVGQQRQVLIKVQGTAVGGPSTISGVLSFGPGTGVCTGLGTLAGNITADDVSQTTITVVAALPCTIGATASAGTITCNGGTTNLTATATGANGTVEYSLNGGAYQSSNTFTVNAAGSPYTVVAREVTNPSCSATTAPVTVTEPLAVPAPTVNVIQPTCTLATGTITITSSTAGLTFSFDGGAYAAYPVGGYTAATGAHTLRAQNGSVCLSAITNITIDAQPPTPTSPAVSVVQPTCTLATGTITITSPTTGLTFSLDGGAYAAYPVSGYTAAAGTHTLTAQNTSGCISTVTNITVDPQPVTPAAPAVNVVQPTCIVATGTIAVTSTTTGLTFSFDGGAYAAYPVGGYTTVAAGPHTLTAQNASSCISTVTNITINPQPATPAAPTVSVVQPTCAVATGTITITSSTTGLTFSLDGGAYAAYPVGGYTVAAGAHTLAAQNTSGCISPITNITVNTQPVTPAVPVVGLITQPTCAINTGTVDLSGLPAGNWTINPGAVAGNTSSVTINGLTQGTTYNFTVTNSVGCTSLATADVVINVVLGAPTAPTVSVVQPTCTVATGIIIITSSTTGLTFSLDGGPYAPYPVGGYVVSAGPHTLEAQNISSCFSPITNITVNAQPSTPAAPTVNVIHPICTVSTGTITITSPTTGLTFSFDGGAYAAYPVGGYTATAGAHTLTAQNTSGCISTITNVTVNAQPVTPPAPTIGTITQPTCIVLTGSVVLDGLPTGSWTINPGAIAGNTASATINGLVPATYNFTVTNSVGCTSLPSADVVITVVSGTPTAPTVNVVHPTCSVATGTITVTSTTTGLNFSLDGGTYAAYPAGGYVVAAGPHTLTAQNAAFCTSPVTNVTVNAQPPTPATPTVSVVHPTCTVATGTITITSTTTGLTFSLDGAAYAVYPAGGYIVAAGPHTLTAQNGSSCISSVTNITVNAQPATPAAPTVSVVHPTCTVLTGIINVTSTTTGLTFSLDGAAYAAYPIGGYTVSAGPHTISTQNSSGCISSVTNITVNAQPSTPAVPTVSVVHPTCAVPTGTITITSATTGLTFSLDGGAYAAYPAGGYTVTAGSHSITAQNTSGCISAVANATVNAQPASPTASAVAGLITCFGGTTTLTVTAAGGIPPYEYSLNGGAFQAGNTFTVGAGSYTVTVKESNNCTGVTSTVTVTQPTVITATTVAGSIACFGATTSLVVSATGGTPPLQYSLNGGAYQAGNTFTVAAGSYSVSIRDANLCTRTLPGIAVTAPSTLAATADAPRITQCGGTTVVTVNANGGTSPYTGTGTFTRGPGTWTFPVTDGRGCTTTARITIQAPGCMDLKVFPNPTSKTLTINHSEAFTGATLQVFDARGAMVLSKAIPQNAFVTTIDVSSLAAGHYVLVILSGSDKKAVLFEKVTL